MSYLTSFKSPTRREISILILAATLFIAGMLMYRGLGNWLVVDNPVPAHIDVIFTFGGESVRDTYSRELATAHPEAVWVVSTWSAAAKSRNLSQSEFDSRKVVIVDTCKSTWSELLYLRSFIGGYRSHLATIRRAQAENDSLRALLAELELVSPLSDTTISDSATAPAAEPVAAITTPRDSSRLTIALVSSPYHMRRIKVAAVRLLNDRTLDIVYTPVPVSRYPADFTDYKHWWKKNCSRRW